MDFTPVIENLPRLASGFWMTIQLTALSLACGLALAVPLALLRVSRRALLWMPAYGYIFFFRGTPLLIQLFWVYFCLPVLFRIQVPPYLSVLIALTLYMAAITCETFRGALKSIASEQHDACVALGLPTRIKTVHVIFPQALLRAIPTLLSNCVSLFKESALISSVGIADLMFVGQSTSNSTARPLEFLTTVGIIYFAVAFPLTRLVGLVESRYLKRFAY